MHAYMHVCTEREPSEKKVGKSHARSNDNTSKRRRDPTRHVPSKRPDCKEPNTATTIDTLEIQMSGPSGRAESGCVNRQGSASRAQQSKQTGRTFFQGWFWFARSCTAFCLSLSRIGLLCFSPGQVLLTLKENKGRFPCSTA